MERVPVDAIDVDERRRPINQQHVDRLAASIKEIGLQTPLSVVMRRDGDDWRAILVAGAHRLAALRQLGEEMAECFVVPDDPDLAELWEIDENFARSELTEAQRADHHVRREAILVRRGEVLSGPGQPKNADKLSEKTSYARQASVTLGVDERTVRRDLARGKKITPEVLADVAGSPLDKGVVLDELAATPREDQRAKLAEITLRRQEVERGRSAGSRLRTRSARPNPITGVAGIAYRSRHNQAAR